MRWLTATFSAGILLLVVLANAGALRTPEKVHGLVPLGDKVGHFVLFGILTWLFVRVVPEPRLRLGPVAVPLVAVALAVLVTVEEASQVFIATRNCSLGDLLADYLGIVSFGWLATRRRRPVSSS